jgi:Na+/phosphate symporter
VTATTPFMHYASARFRREALDELNSIHNEFSQTMVALVASRRKEAKTLALNLAATQAQLAEANKEAQKTHQALLEEQAAASAKDTFITELQSIIAASSHS